MSEPDVKGKGNAQDENSKLLYSRSCILYQNEDQDITLVDVPRSIKDAQSTEGVEFSCDILSCEARQDPYASNEPKSEKARQSLKKQSNQGLHEISALAINHALSTIKDNYAEEWCLPRRVVQSGQAGAQKRKASEMTSSEPNQKAAKSVSQSQAGSEIQSTTGHGETETLLSDCLCKLSKSGGKQIQHYIMGQHEENDQNAVAPQVPESWFHFASNREAHACKMIVGTDETQQSFHVPPDCAFYMANCSDSAGFHAAVRNHAQDEDTRRAFDLIIMDPPWPNSSVRRTKQRGKATYEVASSLENVESLVASMDIDVLLSKGGLVGIWITNKPAIRDLVLGEDGFFASWGVVLQEEWIWVKTTTKGEPVSNLDSLWRKPYECFLLGRKEMQFDNSITQSLDVKRRIIAGVPDLHSRKPSLKELLEPLMNDVSDYRALEIFARHLTAGWWCWGNEVIKFNHDSYWIKS